jgi:8-oxo-dGTP pyrophosphatase MutT (NUDIX family)
MASLESARVISRRRKQPIERPASFKQLLFWMLSRAAIAIYSRVPIFGRLRAAVAVLRKDELLLIIDRSDGRGLSFPGGLAFPWETAGQTMRREVREETGLEIDNSRLLFEYESSAEIPCVISVFEAEARGNLTESWEGSPRWLPSSEIQPLLLPSQREIIDRIQ